MCVYHDFQTLVGVQAASACGMYGAIHVRARFPVILFNFATFHRLTPRSEQATEGTRHHSALFLCRVTTYDAAS
jgi:hypothetical protein